MSGRRPLRLALLALTGFGKVRDRRYAVDDETLAETLSPRPPGGAVPFSVEGMLERGVELATRTPLDDELWEVELKGMVHRWQILWKWPPTGPTARRGRLVGRVDSWTDELAAALAREWIFGARDVLAEAMRAEVETSDALVRQTRLRGAERLAGAGTREEIESAAQDLADNPDSIGMGLWGEPALRALWIAARSVKNKSPRIAAGKAAEARAAAAGAEVSARAPEAFAAGQDTIAVLEAAEVEAACARRRLSEALRARLGLPGPHSTAEAPPVRVEVPVSARILAQILVGIASVFVLLGPALTLDKSLEVEALQAAGISAGGLGLIVLAVLLVFGSRAVRARRWSRHADQLYGETEQPPARGPTVAAT